MNELNPSEEVIFNAAQQLADAEKRRQYLDLACADEPEMRQRIERLLRAAPEADLFFDRNAVSAKTVLAPAAPLASSPASGGLDEQVGTVIGRYKLREKIGEGGCGVVYVAEQTEPVRRRVALKIIKLGMDTKQVVARFEAERQALALMDHPYIAMVLDAGTTETGRPYFVMELVRGIKITEYCDQHQLTTKERLDLFIKTCQAIQHAHQKGVIHRDLKPSNILVTVNEPGSPGVPKVIDFGIAKATGGRLTDLTVYTDLHQFIGTPAYMSPEQATLTSLDIDTRSDIYSLGVLLYELLTGHTPFDTKELMALGVDDLRRTIREQEPLRPSSRLKTMPGGDLTTTAQHRASEPPKLIHLVRGDLDWIVMKCLEKDRTRRYETANGLAADLQRHLHNEPVVARPPTVAYRVQKAWRRHKLTFMAAVVVVATLLVGTSVSSWQAIVARRATHAEKEQGLATQAALYLANINVAQPAWEQNNMGRLRQSLEAAHTWPGRGFEWYYLQKQAHLDLKTLRGHLEAVLAVAASPDGRRIVTGSGDSMSVVWEEASGKELLTLKGHRAAINTAAFSPDGRRIVTGSDDQTAKIWDTDSGHNLLTLRGHFSEINSAAFSPDGRRIVTGSSDRTAIVWDTASGRNLLKLAEHTAPISFAAFTAEGDRIVTASLDQTVKFWDAASGRSLLTLRCSNTIYSAAVSPDGNRVVISTGEKTAIVWDATSGKELLNLKGHSGSIQAVAFSPDGRRIITGSGDKTAKVWDAVSGKELATLQGHSGSVSAVAFFPDGQRMLTGSDDKTAKLWAAASDRAAPLLQGRSAQVYSASFSPDGRRIVTSSMGKTAKVWEAASGKLLFTLGQREAIWSADFSPDGRWIVTGGGDLTAKVWEAASGREVATLMGHRDVIRSVAFSPDSQRIVSGSWDQTAKVWEAASGRELFTLRGHSDSIWSAAFSPDGRRIVTGSSDNAAIVWEAATGRKLLTLRGHTKPIRSVAFSPDSQRIVTGSWDQTAQVWAAASGSKLVALIGHDDAVFAVAFSPDGQRIVTGSRDMTTKIWEAASGRELITLRGHTAPVVSVQFSPDGRQIVTGSEDLTARIWEAAPAEQVAAWQEEDRAASRSLADLESLRAAEMERQRIARERDSIKQWLILAPIPLPTERHGAAGLEFEQIQDEGRLRPKAGEQVTFADGPLEWRPVALEESRINFNSILGNTTEHSVAYAVCYLRSETEQHGLQMLVGSDDESKIYLNGKPIYRFPMSRGFLAEQDAVPEIALNPGLNVVVFKVVNEGHAWMGAIRFTDAQGNPVKGLTVTLDPEGGDRR